MEVATVPLALDDFVPVVLAGIGSFLLAQACCRRQPRVGQVPLYAAAAIAVGGLCKAAWKLNLALAGNDLAHVDDVLFALLGPGFAYLAWALLAARSSWRSMALPSYAVGLAGTATVLLQSTGPLLALTVLGSTATLVLAVELALRNDDRPAAVLFGTSLLFAYALVPLAGADQSISHQWWEQTLNTVGQGAFALASFRLVNVRSYA